MRTQDAAAERREEGRHSSPSQPSSVRLRRRVDPPESVGHMSGDEGGMDEEGEEQHPHGSSSAPSLFF